MKTSIQQFHQHLLDSHLAVNTIKAYMTAVELYSSMFTELDADSLDRYKSHLTKFFKPQTVNQRILAINRFLKFMGKGNLALPIIKMQNISFSDNIVSRRDYNRLKQGLLSDGEIRWYFMIWTMGATGARVSELVKIRIEDIMAGYVDILSKGNKTRRIFFPRTLSREVRRWSAEEGGLTGYLFLNKSGDVISTRGYSMHLKTIADRYGLDKSCVHPHSFRHMYAKAFLDKRSDISTLADLLGHENIKTTQIYLRRSCDEQRTIIDNVVTW